MSLSPVCLLSHASVDADPALYLHTCLTQTDLNVSPIVQVKMLHYVTSMMKWNQTYSLTTVSGPQQIIARHIMDSLSIWPYLHGDQILDVGSGAGLPGIPLALLSPNKSFVLLDSNAKKTRFLAQMVDELGLSNVEVVNARIEAYTPGYRFDSILARAFSSIAKLVALAQHLYAQQGVFLLMKGAYPTAEIADIPAPFYLAKTRELNVPGVDDERTLLTVMGQ